MYHASDRIQAIVPTESTNNEDPVFGFTFRGCQKSQTQEPKSFEFAALNQQEFGFWTSFPASWQVRLRCAHLIILLWYLLSVTLKPEDSTATVDSNSSQSHQLPRSHETSQVPKASVPMPEENELRHVSSARYVRLDVPESPSSSEQKSTSCVVCYDDVQSVVCVPCGHVTMCMRCANQVMNSTRRCPACRMHTREVIKIFRL